MSGSLTQEQLRRIEENKRKALAKRAQKTSGQSTVSVSSNISVPVPTQTHSNFIPSKPSSNYKSEISKNSAKSNTDSHSDQSVEVRQKKIVKDNNSNVCRSVDNQQNVAGSATTSVIQQGIDAALINSKDVNLNINIQNVSGSNGTNQGYGTHRVGEVQKSREVSTLSSANIQKPYEASLLSAAVVQKSREASSLSAVDVQKSREASTVVVQKPREISTLSTAIVQKSCEASTLSAANVQKPCEVSTLSVAERMEQNRLKALARRAERINKSPVKNDHRSATGPSSGPSSSGLTKTSAGLQQNSSAGFQQNASNQSQFGSVPRDSGSFAQSFSRASDSSSGYNSAPATSSVKQPPGPPQTARETPGPPQTARETQGPPQTANSWNAFAALGQGSVKGSCVLVSRERFEVTVGYCTPLIELFKTMTTKMYEAVSKKWTFKLSEYNKFMSAVRALKPAVEIEPLPRAILQAFSAQVRGENPSRDIPMANLSRVEPNLVNSLMSFQRTGVNFGVYKGGRVLIADDMGLGKTIQAICLACYYRADWPLLVVVPSSVRYDWANQIRRWVPSIDPETIRVVVTGKDSCTSGLITIISYDLMSRRSEELRQKGFRVVIVDESHLLKNYKTARCKAAAPLLQNARRVILLSGTPALSRPSELYTQVSAVCPFMLKFHDFGVRYCDGKQMQWGWDFSGSSNMAELQLFLEETVMIRRLKKEVLSELPDKIRHMVMLDPSSIRISRELKTASKVMANVKKKSTEQTGALLDFFHKSGSAKLKAIKNYVDDMLEQEKKFLIFAHHGDVLDGIEETVKAKLGSQYMRIDGRTGSEQRSISCQRFQTSDAMRVAILSITAANAGLNLSAANVVVFAELFWNPGILVQAEDRAHRIGQQDSVSVQYLVATGTSDDTIWPMIQRKLDVLGKAGLTKDNFSNAETTRLKDQQQLEIERFLEESFSEDFDQPMPEEEKEFLQTTPTKAKKQQSILKYTSPMKSPEESSVKKQQSILKYTSPMKSLEEGLSLASESPRTPSPPVKKRKVQTFNPPFAKSER